MPRFRFTAIDSAGHERVGALDATGAGPAALQVKAMGLFPTEIAEDGGAPAAGNADPTRARSAAGPTARSRPFTFGGVIGPRDLSIFTRQLATLLQAGLPLLRALQVLERQERNAGFRWVLGALGETIRSGGSLSDGLQAQPRVFGRLYVSMVKAGEAGGRLDAVLQQLARFLEKTEKVKGKIRAALFYPVTVIVITGVVLSGLLVFVVPKFQAIFQDILKGAPLPALTQGVLAVSDGVRHHAWLLGGMLVGGGLGWRLARGTRAGARAADWAKLNLPLFGDLFRKAAIARFARTLGTLMANGVPILQALLVTRETSGSVILAAAITRVHDRVQAGETVAAPLAATRAFPDMVTSMIAVGEETGALAGMLGRIADTYDDEVDNAVAGLTSLIEPVMIVFLAVVVGTVVIALFLPIVRILQMMT